MLIKFYISVSVKSNKMEIHNKSLMAAILLFYVFIYPIGIVISKINDDNTNVFMLTLKIKPFSVCF